MKSICSSLVFFVFSYFAATVCALADEATPEPINPDAIHRQALRAPLTPEQIRARTCVRGNCVTLGQIEHEQCLASWDDSHNFHSIKSDGFVFKSLRHCIRLRVRGPIDVVAIAKQHLNDCVQDGINNDQAVHLLNIAEGIAVDFLSSTGGAATTAAVGDYINSIADHTLECLQNTDKLEARIRAELKNSFQGIVDHESHWVYSDE